MTLRRLGALLLAALAAGCAGTELAYDATFAMVPGDATTYAVRVLNATEGNVTVEARMPAVLSEVRELPAEGVVRFERASRTEVQLAVRLEEIAPASEAAEPTWTVRIDGLRKTTYFVRVDFVRAFCDDAACRTVAEAQVLNEVKVV